MQNSYIKTDTHITIAFENGDVETVYSTNPYYSKVLAAVSEQDFDEARRLSQPVHELKQQLANVSITDRVSVEAGVVTLDDKPMANSLTDRMIDMIAAGMNVEPMAKFLTNLMENPSHRSVTELYGFMEKSDLPITEDGHFVAYKRVAEDYKDIYSGTMDNSIGAVVEMFRNEVDDDKENTCSNGLHFCSREYLSSYGTRSGNRTVIVKINPKDVVSIPVDYDNAKGRCCRYEVIGELEHMHEEELENHLVFNYRDDDDISDDLLEDEFLEYQEEMSSVYEGIRQIDPTNDKVVALYHTVGDAEYFEGFDADDISDALDSGLEVGGFIWETYQYKSHDTNPGVIEEKSDDDQHWERVKRMLSDMT